MTSRSTAVSSLLALALMTGAAAPVWADAPQDTQVQSAVEAAIAKADVRKPADISVRVQDGQVRLVGFADNDAERFRAVVAAREVPGVGGVEFNSVRLWSTGAQRW